MTAATIETSIRSAIEARVATLPMAGTYPVKWTDGPSYDPNASTPYIRASFFPNTTWRLFLNGSDPHQRLSLLQLDVMGKKAWGGKVVTQIAGQIAEWFPADLRMIYGEVTSRIAAAPHVAAPMAGDVFLQVPVTIPVECFA